MVDMIFLLGIVAGAVVPGNAFYSEGYELDPYFDHIIDLSIEHLNHINDGFYVDLKAHEWMEGTLFFDGLRSLSRSTGRQGSMSHTRIKRLKNGDVDLLSTLTFRNISGFANFSSDNGKKENEKNTFQFRVTPPISRVKVLFMLTKDPFLKRVSYQFVKPLVYDHSPSFNLNAQLLLEDKVPIAFNRLFNDLYNIIYKRQILTADRHDSFFDNALDNVFIRSTQHPQEITNKNQITTLDQKESIKATLNLTIRGLSFVKKMKRAHFIDELNGDIDLRTAIQFGNISGQANVSGFALDVKFEDRFTFTSPPVVVEALFYLPRNRSLQQLSFHFETKANFTIYPQKEHFRSAIENLLEEKRPEMYGRVLSLLLNETHMEVFPKTN